MTGAALELAGLRKSYPGTVALDGADLAVRPGQVHALLGGNGSGKSTVLKILAGIVRADAGRLVLGGQEHRLAGWNPDRAHAAGLRFVHQNPATFADMTVAENVAVGHGFPTKAGRIRWRALRAHTQRLIDRYQIDADPNAPLRTLRPADRTLVAIARALPDADDASTVLALDEPTTSLPAPDVELLLTALRRFAAAGLTTIYVSHRIDEVLTLADQVTVLRDGRVVADQPASGLSESAVVDLIAGRPARSVPPPPTLRQAVPVLTVRELAGGPLRGVDLAVRPGEVLGIAGLHGAGQSELLRMLFGALRPTGGEITLDGRPRRFRHPADAIGAGIAFVPADRAGEAVFPTMSVRHNLSAGRLGGYFRRFRLAHAAERRDVRDAMVTFGVRAAADTDALTTLSGGNQQKVVLARWLSQQPRVLLLDEPTQGVDVSARQDIHRLIWAAAQGGTAVLVVGNDFDELAGLCHRVVVLRAGRVAGTAGPPGLDGHRLTELAYSAEVPS